MIYISTKMYQPGNFMKVMRILDDIEGEVGIELFAHVGEEAFMEALEENRDFLKNHPLSIHEPVAKMEHSAPEGTAEYQKTQETFGKTLELAEDLGADYIVYHTHNKEVDNKEAMKAGVLANIKDQEERAKARILVENVGIDQMGTGLYSQEEFISLAQGLEEGVILDIGHAQANGWDLAETISALKDKIVAYQIYANQEGHDLHDRAFIDENTGYMMVFLELYKKHTPEAHIVLEYSKDFEDREGILMLDVLRLQSILKKK